MRPWTVAQRQTIVEDHWLRVHREQVVTGSGAVLDPWWSVEAADWVCLVPLLPDGRVVLVEQYRHGARLVCRELPAGNIEPGEDPAAAALRELTEETGYRAAEAPQCLGTFWPEPARSSARATGFVVRCHAVPTTQQLDHSEDIAVVTVPFETLFAPDHGKLIHGAHVAFTYLARAALAQAEAGTETKPTRQK